MYYTFFQSTNFRSQLFFTTFHFRISHYILDLKKEHEFEYDKKERKKYDEMEISRTFSLYNDALNSFEIIYIRDTILNNIMEKKFDQNSNYTNNKCKEEGKHGDVQKNGQW